MQELVSGRHRTHTASHGRSAKIGEIYDIILTDAGAVKAYIVSVGGFLGMGTRHVAIDPKAVTLVPRNEKNWKDALDPESTTRHKGVGSAGGLKNRRGNTVR